MINWYNKISYYISIAQIITIILFSNVQHCSSVENKHKSCSNRLKVILIQLQLMIKKQVILFALAIYYFDQNNV